MTELAGAIGKPARGHHAVGHGFGHQLAAGRLLIADQIDVAAGRAGRGTLRLFGHATEQLFAGLVEAEAALDQIEGDIRAEASDAGRFANGGDVDGGRRRVGGALLNGLPLIGGAGAGGGSSGGHVTLSFGGNLSGCGGCCGLRGRQIDHAVTGASLAGLRGVLRVGHVATEANRRISGNVHQRDLERGPARDPVFIRLTIVARLREQALIDHVADRDQRHQAVLDVLPQIFQRGAAADYDVAQQAISFDPGPLNRADTRQRGIAQRLVAVVIGKHRGTAIEPYEIDLALGMAKNLDPRIVPPARAQVGRLRRDREPQPQQAVIGLTGFQLANRQLGRQRALQLPLHTLTRCSSWHVAS